MPPKELHAIRLEPETVEQVDRIAEIEGRTRADVIRRLIVLGLTGYTRETIRKIAKEQQQ